jgi:hypothetical protein
VPIDRTTALLHRRVRGGAEAAALVLTEAATSDSSRLTPPVRDPSPTRVIARWLVTIAGFPLGGLAAFLLLGPIDSLVAALLGGLITGAAVGAVQAWALRLGRRGAVTWTAATAGGLATGLALGVSLVGFHSDLTRLAVQGAVSGAAVGAAQAGVLRSRAGAVALLWPLYLAAVWALGWIVTTTVGIQVDERFTVFGSSGAVTVALLTVTLPVYLGSHPHPATEKRSS